jgi:translation initiation factor 2D
MAVPTRSRNRQALALDMFKKQPSIKNYSALKSSDRRRFQSDVFDAYPVIKDCHSVEGAPSFFTEDLQKAKFSSHIDDLGLVYAMDNSPTWFQVNGPEPIPTGKNCNNLVHGFIEESN